MRSAVGRVYDWLVAQLVERPALNRKVVGSIPTGPANRSVAQLVERRSLKSDVEGSSPSTPTNEKSS